MSKSQYYEPYQSYGQQSQYYDDPRYQSYDQRLAAPPDDRSRYPDRDIERRHRDSNRHRKHETYVHETYVAPSDRRRRRSDGNLRGALAPNDFREPTTRGHRSKSQSGHETDWSEVLMSALVAGGVESFRSRHDPASASRALTAAATAGTMDAFIGKKSDGKSVRHIAESVVAGLAVDRLAHGKARS